MKRSLILLCAFLLCFSLFGQWTDFAYESDVDTPEDSWSIIRMAFDSTGRLYLANSTGKVWYTDNPMDVSPAYTVLLDEVLSNGIQGIAIDADDNVYLSGDNSPDGFIAKFDSTGTAVWSYVLAGTRVTSCTILSTGELLVTSFGGIFYLIDPENPELSFGNPIYTDAFVEAGPKADWDYWWNEPPIATVSVVDEDTDWRGVLIEPRAGGDGWFLKTDYDGAGWGTHGVQVGSVDDSLYTLEAYVYMPYAEGAAVTPALFGNWGGVVGDPYTRVQLRYRDDSHFAEENVIRVQGMAPTLTVNFETYNDGTGPIFDGEGWYHVKARWLPGPQISVWLNGKYVGTADLSGHASGNSGIFGLSSFTYGGQYDGTVNEYNTPQQVYWDGFKAYRMAANQAAGLADFVRDIDSTPADVIFANQSGAVMKVTGGDALNLGAYAGAAFGDAVYSAMSWNVRPTVAYDEDLNAVFSSNFDVGPPVTAGKVFIQNADDGTILQTIEDFPYSDFQVTAVAVTEIGAAKAVLVSGFRDVMRLYKQEEIDVSDWQLYGY